MPTGPLSNSHQNEFQLREPLKGQPLDALVACPDCGSRPVFDRRQEVSQNGIPLGHSAFEYRIRCRWEGTNWDENPCKDRVTPWLKSLELAARHWTLSIKLAK